MQKAKPRKKKSANVLVFNQVSKQWEIWEEDQLREHMKVTKAVLKRQRAEWGCT